MARIDRLLHCERCGAPYADGAPWPRTCAQCGHTRFLNPAPVAVLLQPVGEGLMVIRRGINPRKGHLALPGGFIDLGESWQHAAARELFEETGVTISADQVTLFTAHSAPDSTVLLFGIGPPLSSADLPTFVPTHETSERAIITAPTELAFPLHTQVAEAWFRGRSA